MMHNYVALLCLILKPLSPMPQTYSLEQLMQLSQQAPLRGKAAAAEFERAFALIDAHNIAREAAGEKALTEAELSLLLKTDDPPL